MLHGNCCVDFKETCSHLGKFLCFCIFRFNDFLELDDKTCPYFEKESRTSFDGSKNTAMNNGKEGYDKIECRDFRITSSGYIFIQYEASCLDKDGKGQDYDKHLFESSTDELILIQKNLI